LLFNLLLCCFGKERSFEGVLCEFRLRYEMFGINGASLGFGWLCLGSDFLKGEVELFVNLRQHSLEILSHSFLPINKI
jgi:hypothetical protein